MAPKQTKAPKQTVKQATPSASSKITPMRKKNSGNGTMEVCVIKPSSMEDTREIADTLIDRCTVVLNLEGIDVDVAQRIIDFSSGACYSIAGSLQKISSYIFILTPANVEILDLNELHMVHSFRPEEAGVMIRTFGGYEEAERQIAAFLPDALSYDYGENEELFLSMYPIRCIRISPCSGKFSEALTHRDYLGALIHLGIERSRLGDIVIKGQDAYVFCHAQMEEFLMQNITRIRHTTVKVSAVENPDDLPKPQFQEIHGTVSSVRLDAMIALAFSSSRSSMLGLIEGGKVFVNGKMVVSNGHPLKPEDIVSVRGYGKFRYDGMAGTTKKGRCSVTVQKYI